VLAQQLKKLAINYVRAEHIIKQTQRREQKTKQGDLCHLDNNKITSSITPIIITIIQLNSVHLLVCSRTIKTYIILSHLMLWLVDPLLGHDREISNYKTSLDLLHLMHSHNSGLQVITALSLIYTLNSSPSHTH
jgi:hypothetical protein